MERKIRENWGKMSDEDLKKYVINNFKGKCINYLASHSALIKALRERDLLEKLINEGVIIRLKKHNFYNIMSNEELVEHVRKNYRGKRVSEFGKQTLRSLIGERGLLEILINEGTLIRTKQENGFYKSMTKKEIVSRFKNNHKGKTITQVNDDEQGLYEIARQRGIIPILVKQGIIRRTVRENGYHCKKDNAQLIEYFEKNHKGKSISQAYKDDCQAYNIANERKIIPTLVELGILVREKITNGLWKSVQFTLEKAKTFLEDHPQFHELPTQSKLTQYPGGNSLAHYIGKYHGGLNVFRERLREYMGQPSDKQQLEALLRGYLGKGAA